MPTFFGVTDTFTRPGDTTAYASGDLVANSTSAGSVLPLIFRSDTSEVPNGALNGCYFPAIRCHKSTNTVTNASFRIHLYLVLPTFTSAGDNSAFSTVVATGNTSWRGSYDITFSHASADGASGIAVPSDGVIFPMNIVPAGNPVYGLVEARAAYSPGNAEAFQFRLLVEKP